MSDRDFTRIVEAWLRGEDPDSDWLLDPEYLEDTYDTLCEIKRDVDGQLTSKKADFLALTNETYASEDRSRFFAARAEYETWRARAIAFKRHVESALSDVKALRREAAERPRNVVVGDTVDLFAAIKADPALSDDWKTALCRLYDLATRGDA
jgi:hypothetical protein